MTNDLYFRNLEIKNRIAEGATQKQVAEEFGISRSTVSDIVCGRADGESIHEDTPDIDKLKAEILHLRLEKNLAIKKLAQQTKEQGIVDYVLDELATWIKPFDAPPAVTPPKQNGLVEEHLVMHLSDGHHDEVILPEQCGGLEDHDFKVSCRRAEQYVDTVLKWSQETLKNSYRFPKLTILAYGDFTSGEIHGAVERSEYRNQFKNCLAIGQLHALMYRDLAPYFENVNILYVPGNHGRRSIKKDYTAPHDNWDYLIARTAELYCRDMSNVHFTIPDTYTCGVVIENNLFTVFHGDDVKSSLGIPWYGLQRKQARMQILSKNIDAKRKYFCCGHFHTGGSLSTVDGELLMNGAWVATNSYAYNSLGLMNEPSQLIHGVSEKHGVTWRLNVNLRTQNEKSPKRYKI